MHTQALLAAQEHAQTALSALAALTLTEQESSAVTGARGLISEAGAYLDQAIREIGCAITLARTMP